MRISHCSTSTKGKGYLSRRGVTLLEVVVTLGVIGMLSSVVIGYGRETREQITFMRAEIRAMNLFVRARSMAVSSFLEGGLDNDVPAGQKICGYGVHLDQTTQELFIFRELSSDCAMADRIYSGADERIEGTDYSIQFKNQMVKVVSSSESPDLQDVIFIPPDPIIILNNDPELNDVYMTLEATGHNGTKRKGTIDISDVGKVKLLQGEDE